MVKEFARHFQERICHTNLNPWNVMLTVDHTPKLSGLENCEEWNETQQAEDMYDLGHLVVFCYNEQRVSKEDYNVQDIDVQYQTMYDLACEAQDIAFKLLNTPEYLSHEAVIKHPWLWDKYKRAQFIEEAYNFLKINDQYNLDIWNARSDFYTGQIWTTNLPVDIITRVEWDSRTGNQIIYQHAHPCDLLRFTRNVLAHHSDIRKDVKGLNDQTTYKFLGKNLGDAETSFRILFPKLVLNFYNFFGENVYREDLENLEHYYYVDV